MLNTKAIIRKFLVLTVFLLFASACSSASNEPGLCEWFNKSQEIRTKRIPAILKVQEVYDMYGTNTLDYSNPAMVNDMTNAMNAYIATNEEFVQEWKELGVHPSGENYWENELLAVELYIEGFTKSLNGIENQNMDVILEGARIYESGNEASNKAESEMIALRNKCK